MSQNMMMSAQQRKIQAATICREVRGPADDVIDLGRKVSTPKEIMLEELSLLSNRGSRLFKTRQRRSEKYTFENIQSEAASLTQNAVIILPQSTEAPGNGGDGTQLPKVLHPETARTHSESIVPGYEEPLKDVPLEKFNSTAIPKAYQSPWGQAVMSDPTLTDTLIPNTIILESQTEVPTYKNFNRVATPFGGFDRAPRVPAVKAAELDSHLENTLHPSPELQDPVAERPTFNRTALGWVADATPSMTLQSVLIPESDDL